MTSTHGTDQHGHGHEHGHGHHHGHGHQHGDGQQHGQHADDGGMTGLLELDAEVLRDYWADALDWVRDAATEAGPAPGQLLDLGAGTGTGALGLAARFPAATVTAVDIESEPLARLAERARQLGLAGRVRAVLADLDADWPGLGPLDLTWASMSLHHLADPSGALRRLLDTTRDGGLIAVAEFREPLRFLPDDPAAGPAGFEDRAIAAHGHSHAEAMPTLGSDWAPRLAAAGWHVTAERDFRIDLNPPSHPLAAQYARRWFTRLEHGLAGELDAADQATLAALLDEQGPHALARVPLHIRGTRTVTLARRG